MKARDILQLIHMSIAANRFALEGDVMRRDACDHLINEMITYEEAMEEEANEDQ